MAFQRKGRGEKKKEKGKTRFAWLSAQSEKSRPVSSLFLLKKKDLPVQTQDTGEGKRKRKGLDHR